MALRILPAALVLPPLFALAAPAADPIPPVRVTLAGPPTVAQMLAAVEKEAGVKVDPGAADPVAVLKAPLKDRTFWEALDAAAVATGTRVAVNRQGRQVTFTKPTGSPPAASTDGAFRVTPRGVTARTDFESGKTVYDLALEINWEPRFPVFRVGSLPTITAGVDNRGAKLSAAGVGVKSPVSPAVYSFTTALRLDGLTRQSGKIAALAGSFTVTAAPKMLLFRFDDLAAGKQEQAGVSVQLLRFARAEDRWEAEFDLLYPATQPEFESFETWAGGNTLKLVAPGAGKAFKPDSYELSETSRRVRATYRFTAGGGKGPDIASVKGWQLVYETPAPLVEFPVKFSLKDIPLP